MLDRLIEQIQSQVVPALENDPEVDNAQAEDIAGVSGDTFINSLMEQARSNDFSGIRELFSGDETDTSSAVVSHFAPRIAESLISRLGLSPAVAQRISLKVIPLIMNMLNGKVREAKSHGMDVGKFVEGMMRSRNQGGMLGKLGGLFGGARGSGKGSTPSGNGQTDISGMLGKFFN